MIHLFNAKGLAALDPQWRGRLRLFSDGDIQVIVTAARTSRELATVHALEPAQLADYLAAGTACGLGRERLRQILHARGISFQRTRTWRTADPTGRQADRIEYVTSSYPDRCFAFDRSAAVHPALSRSGSPRKHPVRLRATYHRTHGIRYFHGCYSLAMTSCGAWSASTRARTIPWPR